MIVYINNLGKSIFKILPLKEEHNKGLNEYIDSLLIQMNGALITYPQLKCNNEYIAMLNIINYFSCNEFNVRQCKREVFKCLNILDTLKKEYGL